MADNTEEVRYSYTGDVSSLKQATQSALDLLGKYESAIKRSTDAGTFAPSQRSATSFNSSINKMTKDVEKLQGKLKSVGDVKLPTGSGANQAMAATLQTLQTQLGKLSQSDTVTTKSLNGMRDAVNAVRASMAGMTPQVEGLISSELRFQNVLGTAQSKAESFRNTMDGVKSKISGVFDPAITRLRSFGSVFDSLAPKMQAFKDKAATAFSRTGQLIGTVAQAFRRTAQSADADSAAVDKSAQSHRTLGSVLSSIAAKFAHEKKAIKDESEELSAKDKRLDSSREKHKGLLGAVAALGSKFSSETRSMKTYSTNMKGMLSVTGLLSKAFTGLVGIKMGEWLANATQQSISYIENLNLFTVAMGDSIDKGKEFVATMQELYGMDPNNLMRYAGNFYQLATAIDMPDEAATNLSLSMTKAVNDISSLFNINIETVFENLQSGMQGMSRAVRKYGMDIRVTTLQQTAMSLGMQGQVQNMSEANRQGLRFITMMRQASNATGDFARTIETPANQLRIFKEQITQLGRAIGDFFIGPLTVAISYINGFIMALRTALQFIAAFFGIVSDSSQIDVSGMKDEAEAIGGVGDAATETAKKMQNLSAPFDELNVLQEQTGGGGMGADVMDPALADAIANMAFKFEDIQMKANQVRDELLKFFGFSYDLNGAIQWNPDEFEKNLIDKFPQWSKTIKATFDNWSDIMQGFKNVLKSLGNVFVKVKDKILGFISIFVNDDTVSAFIEGLADSLNKLSGWIDEHADGLANLVITIGLLWAGFKVFSGLSALITPVATFIATCAGALAPFASVIGIAAAVIGSIALLYTQSETFATSFDNFIQTFIDGIMEMLGALGPLLESLWTGIQELWVNNLQPMVDELGKLVGGLLDTLGSLWSNVSGIIASALTMVQTVWENNIKPTLANVFDGVTKVIEIVTRLWNEVFGPVIKNIGDGLEELWNSTFQPIVQKIIEIITSVIDIIMGLWNNVLAPLVNWLVSTLGPSVRNLLDTVWSIIKQLFADIGGVIDGLLTALGGLLDFLAGVFTGDWERAWKGIKNIFIGIVNAIISAFELCVNAVISLINGMISLVYNAVVALINAILSAVEGIADLLGFDLDLTITAPPPAIPYLSIPRVPTALATGGVITSPTYALMGEGQYDEAVIPLGDSPQLAELVQKIAEAVGDKGSPGNEPVEVQVYIGGKEYDAYTYKAAKRGEKIVGAQPVRTGG